MWCGWCVDSNNRVKPNPRLRLGWVVIRLGFWQLFKAYHFWYWFKSTPTFCWQHPEDSYQVQLLQSQPFPHHFVLVHKHLGNARNKQMKILKGNIGEEKHYRVAQFSKEINLPSFRCNKQFKKWPCHLILFVFSSITLFGTKKCKLNSFVHKTV